MVERAESEVLLHRTTVDDVVDRMGRLEEGIGLVVVVRHRAAAGEDSRRTVLAIHTELVVMEDMAVDIELVEGSLRGEDMLVGFALAALAKDMAIETETEGMESDPAEDEDYDRGEGYL